MVGAGILGAVLVLAAQAAAPAAPAPAPATAACPPTTQGLSFVCGVEAPEDVILIPNTRWMITSGYRVGGGLKLVDTAAKTARLFYTGAPTQIRHDATAYAACATAPDVATFRTHGIYLLARGEGRYTLYVVSHGALEAVQIFSVDATGDTPTLTWNGCAPTPAGYIGNGVAAFKDGTMLVTVSGRPGTTKAQELAGQPTGAVLERPAGASEFRVVAGGVMAGNNGIEVSPDDREFYVAGFGGRAVAVFSRAAPATPLRQSAVPGFLPDNLRWSSGRLVVAGPMYDEPACGGTRLDIVDMPAMASCRRGYIVAQLDPASMKWKVLDYGPANPGITGVSAAVIVGDTLWIGALNAQGVAYKPLPGPPPGAMVRTSSATPAR